MNEFTIWRNTTISLLLMSFVFGLGESPALKHLLKCRAVIGLCDMHERFDHKHSPSNGKREIYGQALWAACCQKGMPICG